LSTYLLLDIGNSNIKIALSSNNRFRLVNNLVYTKEKFSDILDMVLQTIKCHIDFAGISLTDSKLKPETKKSLKRFGISNLIFIDSLTQSPIKISYKKTLGSDRICGGVAASYLYPERKNILFVDFGTATTYNLITNKIFQGGMITPGISTSLNSLIGSTALPEVKLSVQKFLINKDTISNIKAGVYFNVLYSFERIISELKKKYRNLFIIVTGGNKKLIIRNTKLINAIESNLVLKGIAIILEHYESLQTK